jgi:putative ABC transport system ATP-binding protein
MITGVITPTTGKIIIDDDNITDFTQEEKDAYRLKNIGYIFQDFKLIEDMTVEDNLNLLKIGKVECLPIDEVLDSVGIKSKRKNKIKHLSGGERQRVAIARALIKQPRIIIADEPTGNLNFENGKKVVELLIKASKKFSNTMIIVTHDDRLVEYFDETLHFEDMLIREGGNVNV